MIHIDFDDLARPSCSRDPIHRNHVVSFLVPRYIITSGLVSTVIVRRGALGSNCRHLTTPPLKWVQPSQVLKCAKILQLYLLDCYLHRANTVFSTDLWVSVDDHISGVALGWRSATRSARRRRGWRGRSGRGIRFHLLTNLRLALARQSLLKSKIGSGFCPRSTQFYFWGEDLKYTFQYVI